MAVHIRLTRVGATRRPAYRVIAIDSRRSRDGRALEILGFYDPLTDPITVKLDDARIANWVARGALPSAAVQRLMKVAAAGPRPPRKPTPAVEETAAKPRRASRAKKSTAEPEAEPAQETTAEPAEEPTTEATAEPAAEPTTEATAEPMSEAADDDTAEATPYAATEAPTETAAEAATESDKAEA